jgi:hypothetical protein
MNKKSNKDIFDKILESKKTYLKLKKIEIKLDELMK